MKFWALATLTLLVFSFEWRSWAAIVAGVPLFVSPNLLSVPATGPGQNPNAAGTTELTLEDSVRKAIQGGTTVLKAEYDNRYSGAQLLQAYGQFLPNLSGSASYGYGTGSSYGTSGIPSYVTSSGTNASYSITTDLNVFNGLSDYANLKSALRKKNASQLTLFRAKQQIKLDVIQGFLQVVLDHRLVDIAVSSLQVSQEREKLFSAQVKAGIRHLADLFRQQAQTSNQELQLLSTRNRLLADQLTLLKKLRIDVIKGYRFIEPAMLGEKDMPPLRDEKTLLETALANRTDLKASVLLTDANRWDISSAWGAYLPKVDLVAGLSSAGSYLDSLTVNGAGAVPVIQNNLAYQLGDQIQYMAAVRVTWTLFDRFLTHQTVSRLQAFANGADLDLQDQKNTVEADVRQAYGNYLTALQQLRASAIGVEAAQKAYQVLAGRYTVGGVSLLDLLTGQDVLVQALASRAQALIAFQLQEAALRFATGEMTVE